MKRITELLRAIPPLTKERQKSRHRTICHPPISSETLVSLARSLTPFPRAIMASVHASPAYDTCTPKPLQKYLANDRRAVSGMVLCSPNFSSPLSRHLRIVRRVTVTAMGVLLVGLSACTALPKENSTRIEGFVETATLGVVGAAESPVTAPAESVANAVAVSRSIISESTDVATLETPFRLAFVAVPADSIMRRLAEYTNIEWVAQDTLLSELYLSVDLDISTTQDVYSLVNMIARAGGFRVEWDRNKVAFFEGEQSVLPQTDGYLITDAVRSADLVNLIDERYNVQCSDISAMTLCIGQKADLDRVSDLISTVNDYRTGIHWVIMQNAGTEERANAILETVGLSEYVQAKRIARGRLLVAAATKKELELAKEVINQSSGGRCVSRIYRGTIISASDLLTASSAYSGELCGEIKQASETVLVYQATAPQNAEFLSYISNFDRQPLQARLLIVVVSDQWARSAGASVDWGGTIPFDDDFEQLSFEASLESSDAARAIEVTTMGSSSASVDQTDQIDGNVVVTDGGSRIQGQRDRTVGLSIDVAGSVTPNGFIGTIDVVDSDLRGDSVFASRCDGVVSLSIKEATRVCQYERRAKSRQAGLLSIGDENRLDRVSVYAVLLRHQTAPAKLFAGFF